jgi:MATE family multidrug resistance protein
VAFNATGLTPPALQGAPGLWSSATAGLSIAALGMCAFLLWMLRRQMRA